MEKPLISIIIPVYNVEKYLRRSIESVLCQTYHNLEIILVDDGSTDSSGCICDEFEQKDDRVTVIHKENGGQGSARNCGLEICTGEFVYFHDSDDWLDEDCIWYLYNLIDSSKTQISACNYKFIDEMGKCKGFFSSKSEDQLFNGYEVLEHMWNDEIINIAPWAKLFSTSLWKSFRFKECYCEDSATMYLLYSKDIFVSYGSKAKVNYLLRQTSDVRSFSERKLYMLDIYDDIVDYAKKQLPSELQKAAISKQVAVCFHILSQLPDLVEYKEVKNRIQKTIKENRINVLLNKKARTKNRIACLISFLGIDTVTLISKRKNSI